MSVKYAMKTANSRVVMKTANLNRSEQQITEERHEPHKNEDGDISKNQEDSGAELQNNDVRIRFVPNNTLMMNKGSQNLPEVSMAIQLPIEFIDYIIKLAVCIFIRFFLAEPHLLCVQSDLQR